VPGQLSQTLRVAQATETEQAPPPLIDRMREPSARGRIERGREASGRKKKESKGAYLVQVGSFRRKAEARDWLRDIERRYEDRLSDTRAQIIEADGRYRTRFEGLTRTAAGEVCRALHAHHLACMVMRS
jgi:hypothetical protein